ncbi:hypothetical protein OESDEN_17400 [Oesophagostomum dentatum]|uniref:Ground-like domain protein n=2 Tax=Oesophagostomum dentatum TaxID=61180 RepID=A0A0B1SI59_OESDE|nr:hypothetical protein OESDEN_17400 [Oesophagostomum dentatum]
MLRENMKSDVSGSLKSLGEKLKDQHDFTVLCSDNKLKFIADADDYCQVEIDKVYCALFRINLKRAEPTPATKVESSAAVKAETQAVVAATDAKKDAEKPEIKKD